MTNIRMMLIAVCAVFVLNACGSMQSGGLFQKPGPAEEKLNNGVKSYEEGSYKTSMLAMHSALDMGLKSKDDQVRAHKYLAFMECISGHEKLCRDEFKAALALNPDFDLKPAEAGHPVWGPVFRSVKGKSAK